MASLVLKGVHAKTLDSTLEVGFDLCQATLKVSLDHHMDEVRLEDVKLTRGLVVPIQHMSEDTLRGGLIS